MNLQSLLLLPLALLLALLFSSCNDAGGDSPRPEDGALSVSIAEDAAATDGGADTDPDLSPEAAGGVPSDGDGASF
ncbi:MAG: hypothetical protein LUF28_00465 [Clostridiales bacterium]|nr:hypothetical protein [Clostridiales bacterium]